MKKNILFYYSGNQLSIDLSSLMIGLTQSGYNVSLLTSCEKGELHQFLEKQGVKTYSKVFKKNIFYYFYHIIYLAFFTRKHKVNIVYSHIQVNNFIACFAQFFTSKKFILFRHHSDYVRLGNSRGSKFFDWVIAKFAYKVVAISDKVKEELIVYDRVPENRVLRINNAYYFDLFPKPNKENIEKLKLKHLLNNNDNVIINIGRMIPLKRQSLLIDAVRILIKKRFNIKLLMIGSGSLETKLKQKTVDLGVEDYIIFPGQVQNIVDYMSIADLQVHVSESEASSNVIKEFSLLKKPSIVCKDVGDFNDYCNTETSFMINKDFTIEELALTIEKAFTNKNELSKKGEALNQYVFDNFNMETTLHQYTELLNDTNV